MDYRIEFSKRLIQLREQRGITQQELADKLKITRQSLSLKLADRFSFIDKSKVGIFGHSGGKRNKA